MSVEEGSRFDVSGFSDAAGFLDAVGDAFDAVKFRDVVTNFINGHRLDSESGTAVLLEFLRRERIAQVGAALVNAANGRPTDRVLLDISERETLIAEQGGRSIPRDERYERWIRDLYRELGAVYPTEADERAITDGSEINRLPNINAFDSSIRRMYPLTTVPEAIRVAVTPTRWEGFVVTRIRDASRPDVVVHTFSRPSTVEPTPAPKPPGTRSS